MSAVAAAGYDDSVGVGVGVVGDVVVCVDVVVVPVAIGVLDLGFFSSSISDTGAADAADAASVSGTCLDDEVTVAATATVTAAVTAFASAGVVGMSKNCTLLSYTP